MSVVLLPEGSRRRILFGDRSCQSMIALGPFHGAHYSLAMTGSPSLAADLPALTSLSAIEKRIAGATTST